MRILVLHNRYQLPGGEDVAVQAETELLGSHGHDVRLLEWNNDGIDGIGAKLRAAASAIYSRDSRRRIENELEEFCPNVVHIHNFLPLMSPSAYFACSAFGVPVVQTLHNYRLLCPSADFFRRGRVCEDCLGRSIPWPGVAHACYRDSHIGTASVAAMLVTHRTLSTFAQKISAYIALTEFSRGKFIQGGLPEKRIFVKPNFLLNDPGRKPSGGEYAVFVGRFSEQKGLRTLLAALTALREIPVLLVGDGPLRAEIESQASFGKLPNVRLTGWLPREQVLAAMWNARCLLMPCQSYENFPITVLEAFALGLPVICSRLGAMQEIVQDGLNGLHFEPGNPISLADRLLWAWQHSSQMEQMGCSARREFEAKYSAATNYNTLMAIYQQSIGGNVLDAAPGSAVGAS